MIHHDTNGHTDQGQSPQVGHANNEDLDNRNRSGLSSQLRDMIHQWENSNQNMKDVITYLTTVLREQSDKITEQEGKIQQLMAISNVFEDRILQLEAANRHLRGQNGEATDVSSPPPVLASGLVH